ncbi:hypothetical protein ERJ70_18690 [Sediminibacillus dalangtanensis]|uniref:YcxB-like C-terminal domain-containing protein n=1 Tax=Sediminibacillus dalangtanensis TaxID=2729421 RepID=A0ABX7VVY4_9BACI|nr:YcxB family protein [Sediminibacillus dalangtanensis]QTN01135.1 hypothetical protein ERJ70_18690 [Sediminibacillus dalangtanensis]
MVLLYDVNLDDLMALQKESLCNSSIHIKRKLYGRLISTVSIFVLMLISLGRPPFLSEGILAIILTVVFFLIFNPLYDWLTLLSIKRIYKKSKPSPLLGQHKVTISKSGIERETDNFKDHYSWEDVERIGEDSEHFFLYVSDIFAIILKKETINLSTEEKAEYLKTIRGQTSKNLTL